MQTPQVQDPVQAGRAALARHAWHEAYELLTAADRAGALRPEDLLKLSEAAWWAGHLEEALGFGQRGFGLFSSAGRATDAARAAQWLAILNVLKSAFSVAGGWMKRAERLLEDQPDSVAHGFQASLQATFTLMMSGDLDQAWRFAERALELGRRFKDPDLTAFALNNQAQVLVRRGEVEKGLALIDEVMVSAVSGELQPFHTGSIFCSTISLCTEMGDYERAIEWCEEALRWCESESINGYPGQCRIYRASLHRLRGDWTQAEEELREGIEDLSAYGRLAVGAGLYEMGEIYRRRGELEAAEKAYRQASEAGQDPQPGLSLLRLAQGKLQPALSSIQAALQERPKEPLTRGKLLPALVDIALEAGQLRPAREAVEELASASALLRTTALEATALQARGQVELAEGRPAEARQSLREAWRLWSKAGLPYEGARTRELLAVAHLAEGDAETARLELEGADAVYERLGARPDHERAVARLRGEGPAVPPVAGTIARRAFLFTDIVGSSQLLEVVGDEGWRHLVRWHDETLRATFARHDGHEVDHTGDGFFVAFEDPAAALRCAMEIQRTLAEHRRSHGFSPRVRIGIHGADATRRGRRYLGKGVHQAARIAALAAADEVLVSRQTLPGWDGYAISASRQVELKGLSEPVEVLSLSWA